MLMRSFSKSTFDAIDLRECSLVLVESRVYSYGCANGHADRDFESADAFEHDPRTT